ncbi:MAG: divergent polysaccharide deacetylase family protein [Synergistes sp.]|nr:divergent polysaccharide deacetylase family protein [Synergistes sp.]
MAKGKHYRKQTLRERLISCLIFLTFAVAVIVPASYFINERCGVRNDSGKVAAGNAVLSSDTSAKDAVVSEDTVVVAAKPISSEKFASRDIKETRPIIEIKEHGKPKMVIVVDDGGVNLKFAHRLAALDIPLTWAIMPYMAYTADIIEVAKKNAIPFIVHLPMKVRSDKDSSDYIIGDGMTYNEVREKTKAALDSMHGAVGLNNHRGSMATTDRELMKPVMDELYARGLLFLDSRVIGGSVAYNVAKETGIPALKNNGFLDNVADESVIWSYYRNAAAIAVKKNKTVIVICHFRPHTIAFLEELNKVYKQQKVSFVTLPELIKEKKNE